MKRTVIVGGGQAGAALAAKLRGLGYDEDITLVCGEDALPYQRPPLSKKYLMKDMAVEQLYLRPESFYLDNRIEVIRGRCVTAIDPACRCVDLDGQGLTYDALALTTGASPRHLPAAIGGDLDHVYAVRSIADVDRMAPEFMPGRRVLVVGGGYIGLEAAAVAVRLGLCVTLVEAAPRILQRVAAPETSTYFRNLHTGHGVEMREGVALERLEAGKPVTARFTDGTTCEADFVIVGIGIAPNDALARDAGLACDDGIVVDAGGRTSASGIWSCGDCTRLPYRGRAIRLESVQNAIDQAEIVAANMLGMGKTYDPNPWFWSDQYDVKLQIAGLNTNYDGVIVREDATRPGRSHWYFADDTLLAVDAMNDSRAYMIGKRLIEAGRSPARDQVADVDFNLKSLL